MQQLYSSDLTASQWQGIEKLICVKRKGRKRFLLVDTMGHLLWTGVEAANVADGKAGVLLWQQARLANPLLDDIILVYADGTFGGYFRTQLEAIHGVRVVIPKTPIASQNLDNQLVIHQWLVRRCGWVVEPVRRCGTISWLGNNRRLAKDYERTLLSAQSFLWIAHIRRTIKRVFR